MCHFEHLVILEVLTTLMHPFMKISGEVLTSLCKTVVVGEYMLLLDGEHAWKVAESSSFLIWGVGVIPVPSVDIIDTCNSKLLSSK
jgi:hypothetical protein